MTRPETCGAEGGAVSVWINVIGFFYDGGIVSSFQDGGTTGSLIDCYYGTSGMTHIYYQYFHTS